MTEYSLAGYRVIEFPQASRAALREVAERLLPHKEEIVQKWIAMQFAAWAPPGFSREQLNTLFGDLIGDVLACMSAGTLETCVTQLEETGADLARHDFPYEALIISLHFLEESYMPFLLSPASDSAQKWLISMDEFLHVGIAALATSYFDYHREQLLADAETGRIVQEALFPRPPKKLADLELGFAYASASERARLGGDFLDVFRLSDDRAAFLVGDLSGHGLEAASGSAMIRSLFRGFLRDGSGLIDAVQRLNRVLVQELQDNQFATALAGTYETPGRVTLVNAGNPPAIVCERIAWTIEATGLPLGVYPDSSYESAEALLGDGDVLVCYTDGLSEARVGANLLGEDRVLEAVREARGAPARAIAELLQDRAVRHSRGTLMDDLAILVLKRKAG